MPEEYQDTMEPQPHVEEQVDALAAHYRQHMPPPAPSGVFPTSSATLTHPILIPQSFVASFNQPPPPFLRAYPTTISSQDINPTLFLAILDTLNLCLAPPPPLQALSLVGQGVGMVPHHAAQGVSAGIGLVAGVGVAVTRITKLKRFLEQVNQDVFAPRGLAMEVVKDEEVVRLLGLSPSMLDGPNVGVSAPKTRLDQLAPYIAPLSFDVPPPVLQASVMDRISAQQTAARLVKEEKHGQKQQQRREDKMHKLETKLEGNLRGTSSDDDSLSSLRDEAAMINTKADSKLRNAEDRKEVAKIEKKRAKELDDLHKKQRKHQQKYDKEIRKIGKKEHKQEEKDIKKMAKLEWILIRNR